MEMERVREPTGLEGSNVKMMLETWGKRPGRCQYQGVNQQNASIRIALRLINPNSGIMTHLPVPDTSSRYSPTHPKSPSHPP